MQNLRVAKEAARYGSLPGIMTRRGYWKPARYMASQELGSTGFLVPVSVRLVTEAAPGRFRWQHPMAGINNQPRHLSRIPGFPTE